MCNELGTDTIEGIKACVPTLKKESKKAENFKPIYKFTFEFSRDRGFKNVNVDTAIALWDLLLKDRCKFIK